MAATTTRARPPVGRRWAVRIGAAVAAALLVGVPAALIGRLLMRFVVLAGGGTPEPPTLGGTAGIAMVFVVFALPAALTMAALPHRARRIGMVFAAVFTVFPAGLIAAGDLGNLGLLSAGRQVATVAVLVAFVVLFAAYGRLLARVVVRLLGRPGAAGAAPGPS